MTDQTIDVETGEVLNVAALDTAGEGALSPLIRPVADIEECEAAFTDYQQLNQRLLRDSDFARIQGKMFTCRSGWRKLAVFYGVSMEVRDHRVTYDDDGVIQRAEFLVRATAPNGRFADGWGAASSKEAIGRGEKADHNLPAVAETRAKNRAAADLFGMGEVSAEEIDRNAMTRTATRQQKEAVLRKMQGLQPDQMAALQEWWADNIERLGGIKKGDDPVGGSLRADAIPEIEERITALFTEQGEPF